MSINIGLPGHQNHPSRPEWVKPPAVQTRNS
jgi:hypothetical protein